MKTENTDTIRYRQIAKQFAKGLPVEGDEFGEKVNEFLAVIKKLPKHQKLALKHAYIFGSKVPREEREDMFQELLLTLLEHREANEKLSYAIAKCDWRDWWSKYYRRSQFQHISLTEIADEHGTNAERLLYHEDLLVSEIEFERKADDRVNGNEDCQRIWEAIPKHLQKIVQKRLYGYSITGGERRMLDKWIAQRPTVLAS